MTGFLYTDKPARKLDLKQLIVSGDGSASASPIAEAEGRVLLASRAGINHGSEGRGNPRRSVLLPLVVLGLLRAEDTDTFQRPEGRMGLK